MDIKQIKRLVFYGCSFTVGAELSDHEFFPNLTRDEIEKIKQKEGYDFYFRLDMNLLEKADKQKSWARWFAEELNFPWENRAKPGCSLGQMIFELERDISTGFIQDTDLIIMGITSPERICTFNEHGCRTLILNFQNGWISKNFEMQFRENIANDDYILYNWVKDIKYLDLLSERLNGRLLQQWVWATFSDILNFKYEDGTLFYEPLKMVRDLITSQSNFKSIIDDNFSFTAINAWDEKNRYAFHHPKIELHKQFSHQLAQSFRERFKL